MSLRVMLKHTTRYLYDSPVMLSAQLIRLRPAPHCRTEIERYRLTISPPEHLIHWQQDPFNNYVARVMFAHKVPEMALDVEIIANLTPQNPFDFYVDDLASQWPFSYGDQQQLDLAPYLHPQEDGPQLQQLLQYLRGCGGDIIPFLLMVNQQVLSRMAYTERLEHGVQHSNESLLKGSGSCRDSAWLLIQLFRHLGLAARFVSGYSIQLDHAPPGASFAPQDSTDLHAWAEVFIPGAGWIGLDPTAGLLAGEGYIPLCCTRSPESAAPVSGITEACRSQLLFSNRVSRLND